jgi:hypothetical protein
MNPLVNIRSGLMALRPLLLLALAYNASAECQRTVQMAEYSICVPAGWNVDREGGPLTDRVTLCKLNAGDCMKNKSAYPYPGVLVVDVQMADKANGVWKDPDELIARARLLNSPVPSISDVPLKQLGAQKRTCWVARVLEYGDLWDETYGLIVSGHRFHVRVFYNDEPANIESFRSTVVEILSSVAIISGN